MVEQSQNKPSWITRPFSNPVYSGVASLIGVIGVLLSIYFFYAAREVPDLTYYVSPTRTAIVTGAQNQKLSVSYADHPVHGDISSAQITIWNAGKKPVTHSDFLTPPTLIVNSPILDAKILNESRRLIGFEVSTGGAARGMLALDWRILEHNDGVRIQIIYAGEPNARIVLGGAIVGQHAPSTRSMTADETQDSAWRTALRGIALVLVVVAAGVPTFRAIVLRFRNRRESPFSRPHWIVASFFFTVMLSTVGGMLYLILELLYTSYLNSPPFGF